MIDQIVKVVGKEMKIYDLSFSFYPRGKSALNTVLIFDGGNMEVIAKYSIRNSSKVNMLSEVLDSLSKKIYKTEIEGSIPSKINIQSKYCKNVSFQEALKGMPANKYVNGFFKKSKALELLGKSIKWLSYFHKYCDVNLGDKVESVYLSNRTNYDISSYYIGPMHGDFVCTNILYYKDELKVIDWEEYTPKGVPFIDVIFAVVSFASKFSSKPVHYSLYVDNWFSRKAGTYIREYCKTRELNPEVIRESVDFYFDYSIYYSKKRERYEEAKNMKIMKKNHDKSQIVW